MGGGGSKNTTTQTNEPAAYALPYLRQGLSEAAGAYQQGPRSYYPGNMVTPFSAQTQQAMNMAQQRAMAGSPVTRAAQNLATQTLQGKFLGGNPHLDSQINRAIQLSRGGLASEFAGMGRDVGKTSSGHFPARAEQIKYITNDFLWRNYDAERARQQAMVPQAGGLAAQDYADIGQLANVGGSVEDMTSRIISDRARRHDFDQAAMDDLLDRYLARTGQITPALGGTTLQTAPRGSQGLANTGAFLTGLGTLASNWPSKKPAPPAPGDG